MRMKIEHIILHYCNNIIKLKTLEMNQSKIIQFGDVGYIFLDHLKYADNI